MHIRVEERVFSSFADSSGCLGSALVAGDSNVHRIQAAIPNWSTIRCLPVSGESLRYVIVSTRRVRKLRLFYVLFCHEKKNDRRVSSTLARVFNRWIQNANTMLMNISEAIPYIRFLGYGAQKSTKSSRSQPNSKSTISTSSLNPVEKTSPPHQDELDIADHADFSKLKLLLSFDVEQNPGPTYHCEWNNCGFIGLTTTRMGQHLRQHGREEECKWAQWNGFQRTSYEDLELHIIHDHFFDDRITFPSLDDWLEYLPEKRIDPETTDLRFCPKHLRSKLKLLLFDEDYLDMPTNKSYTMSDHLCTLDFEISILPFSSTSTAKFMDACTAGKEDRLQALLLDFRHSKLEQVPRNSREIFQQQYEGKETLLSQSKALNCLPGDDKRKTELFIGDPKFASNFINKKKPGLRTSLRYLTFSLFLQNKINTIFTKYRTCYPDLNAVQCEVLEIPALERPSKKRKSTASVKVTKDVEPFSVMQESKKSMYEQFSIDLIEDGKIYIQVAEEDTMICCMNDFNDSGSLRKEVDVYTTWLKQESGDYFHCTCSIYRTLFDIAHSQTLNYSNRNSCMHCTFLKCIVLPNLQIDKRAKETKTRKFVQEGKQCAGKDLIELSDFNGTRKFSVLEKERLNIHNKAKANYTVTCHNGECQSKKGHKRYLNNLNSSNLCRHLFVLKHNPESWIDLHEKNATNETFLDDQLLDDETNDDAGDGDPVDTNANFDPETGLWKYKCESSHPAAARERADGSLKGPNFYPDMPDNTCCCGSGWLKLDDNPDYSENGKLIPLGRVLTVYTQFAPVQCDVYKRVCYNPIDDNRCELAWNVGQSESIHVFSSKTAAGDEIGWEFTSSVMKTGCSAYCQMKDELYRTRDPKAKFMDATVFFKMVV
ncbi:hypothetical protein MAR_004933 [Mya arenaria]|uniref:C2H2-type domain-containing protein n=1 Tax=Mya arenaria TaxID=6604 RepID=A0ABY7F252_MYAAR|nr:hypothetical protein MAR_004933 [Mya arenaria]